MLRIVIEVPGLLLEDRDAIIAMSAVGHVVDTVIRFREQASILLSVGFSNLQDRILFSGLSIPRHVRDYTASLAAQINGTFLLEAFRARDIPVVMLSSVHTEMMDEGVEKYSTIAAKKHLQKGEVIITVAGVEQDLFDEDFAAVLRALEIEAHYLFKPISIDSSPFLLARKDSSSRSISYEEMFSANEPLLKHSALSLCKQHHLPVVFFDPSAESYFSDFDDLSQDSVTTSKGFIVLNK